MGLFAVTARVDLSESAMLGFTAPGGSVWNHVTILAAEAAVIAAEIAPKRTRLMANSISPGRAVSRGYAASARIWCRVPYATYVNLGTTGPIFPSQGQFLILPPRPPSYPAYGAVRWVSGQAANPFMMRALTSAVESRRVAGLIG